MPNATLTATVQTVTSDTVDTANVQADVVTYGCPIAQAPNVGDTLTVTVVDHGRPAHPAVANTRVRSLTVPSAGKVRVQTDNGSYSCDTADAPVIGALVDVSVVIA